MMFNSIPLEIYTYYILPYVIEYQIKQNPKVLLLDWIDYSKLATEPLSGNSNVSAIDLLIYKINKNRKNLQQLDWNYISANRNPVAIELLKDNMDKIDWTELSGNPCAMKLLKANMYRIHWGMLSKNPSDEAIELLKAHMHKICWTKLSENPHPAAIELLKANVDKINWHGLSQNRNPSILELLKANITRIHWNELSRNPNIAAIEILKENMDRIDWNELPLNETAGAVEILKANIHRMSTLNWAWISSNPGAIELLKDNVNMINLSFLSANSMGMSLLKNEMDKDYRKVNYLLNWNILSYNPGIFKDRNEYIETQIRIFCNEYNL